MADSILMCSEIKELGRPEEIIKLLECPICQAVPIPPIWNCLSGHIVCDQCRSQINSCGLCRESFTGGRNLFMEALVEDCKLSCPYSDKGCKQIQIGSQMKIHATVCQYGPQIRWIACQGGNFPPNAVVGGLQRNVKLYVIRAPYSGSNTPGKLYEYSPPGETPSGCWATLPWGGGERMSHSYEVLVSLPQRVKWIPSSNGTIIPDAVKGGRSETGETLFIGRFRYRENLINGKIHPSHGCCYIGIDGLEKASKQYEILVNIENSEPDLLVDDNGPDYFS